MRSVPLLLITAAIAGCSTAPPPGPYARSPEAQAQLQRLIGGRAAGPALNCIPDFRTDRLTSIDPHTIAIDSGNTVYVNNVSGPCYQLGLTGYTMRLNRPGGTGLCRGEVIEVVHTSTGNTVASCALGEFIPYRRI